MEALLSSFVLVALAEMGDKTQLLAFSLATRFKKPVPVMMGIVVATILNHAMASYFGNWFSIYMGHEIGSKILSWILGISFILFGVWTLKPDVAPEGQKKTKPHSGFGVFASTALLFFLAEMGDKTQLATFALGAKFQSPLLITMGTTTAMTVTDGIAVWAGDKLAHRIPMRMIRTCAAGLFFIFGILTILKI